MRSAVHRLPTEQRQAHTLAYYGGYTQSEIKVLIGAPSAVSNSPARSRANSRAARNAWVTSTANPSIATSRHRPNNDPRAVPTTDKPGRWSGVPGHRTTDSLEQFGKHVAAQPFAGLGDRRGRRHAPGRVPTPPPPSSSRPPGMEPTSASRCTPSATALPRQRRHSLRVPGQPGSQHCGMPDRRAGTRTARINASVRAVEPSAVGHECAAHSGPLRIPLSHPVCSTSSQLVRR